MIFASPTPVPRETLAALVGPQCRLDELIADIRDELRARPYELVHVAGGWHHRLPSLPDLPTVHESGLGGYESQAWFGVAALNAEIVAALRAPGVGDRLLEQGAEPVGSSPDAFGAFLEREDARWSEIAKAVVKE